CVCVCVCVCVCEHMELNGKASRSEEHTSELQSHLNLVCRLLLEKKTTNNKANTPHEQQPHKTNTHSHTTHNTHAPRDTDTHTNVVTITQHNTSFFFFNDTATTEIYTLSLHDALPI